MPRPRRPSTPPPVPHSPFDAAAFAISCLIVLLLPLVWSSAAHEAFRSPKSELSMALWASLAALFVARNTSARAWRDPWWLAWAGVLAGGLVSALLAAHPWLCLLELAPLVLAALGWGALRQLPEERRARLVSLVVVAGVIEALVTLAFLVPSWQPESFRLIPNFYGRYSWIGTLGNPADVAVFLVLPALLATARAFERRRRRTYVAAALLIVVVIVGSRTLSAVAALVLGEAVLLWRRLPARRRRLGLGAALVAVIVVVLTTPLLWRIVGAANEALGGGWIWLGSGRGAGVAAAVSMAAARPVTGVGFGMFEANSFRYQTEATLAARGRELGMKTGFGEAHDDLLQYGAETGLLGVLLAAGGLVLAWRRRSRGGDALPCRAPLLAAVLVLVLSQFPLHLAAIAAQWVVLAALALPPLEPPRAAGRLTHGLQAVVIVAIAAAMAFVAWRRYTAWVALEQGSTLSSFLTQGTPRRTGPEIAAAALARLEPKLRWIPGSWEASVTLGDLAMKAGDVDGALAHFEAARSLAERPEIRFDLGMALLASGERDAGMADLVRAVKLNPAIYRGIENADLARDLRRRLDLDGYSRRHPWIYEGTAAGIGAKSAR
jgi:tetratricopeptide (TPR) repeat protein